MHQRATLTAYYGVGKSLPADIVRHLAQDTLGTGVHVKVASLERYDSETGIARIHAELVADDSILIEGVTDPQSLAQAQLNAIYGEVTAEELVESDVVTTEETPPPTTSPLKMNKAPKKQSAKKAATSPPAEPEPTAQADTTEPEHSTEGTPAEPEDSTAEEANTESSTQ